MMIVMSCLPCATNHFPIYLLYNPRIETSQGGRRALGSGDRDRDFLARWVLFLSLSLCPLLARAPPDLHRGPSTLTRIVPCSFVRSSGGPPPPPPAARLFLTAPFGSCWSSWWSRWSCWLMGQARQPASVRILLQIMGGRERASKSSTERGAEPTSWPCFFPLLHIQQSNFACW